MEQESTGTGNKKNQAHVEEAAGAHIDFIREVALFSELKNIPEALHALAKAMVERKFKKGSNIIVEGESGTEAFFLVSGNVNISKSIGGEESFPVAALDATQRPFFGESALLEKDSRSATINTLNDCTCLILEKNEFDKFCKNHPQWAMPIVLHIAGVIMQRLRKSNDDVIQLYNALVNEVRGN